MPAHPRPRPALAALVLLLAVGTAGAQGAATAGDLVVERPWARASIGAERPGAAYLTVRNVGAADDALTAVETPAAHMAELHRTEMQDGVASMTPVDRAPIPAGGEMTLAPRGVHVMLMMLTAPLKEGDSFPMALVFERAGRIEIDVPVHAIGSSGPDE